jgi:hypothetical protein
MSSRCSILVPSDFFRTLGIFYLPNAKKSLHLLIPQTAIVFGPCPFQKLLDKCAIHELKALSNGGVFVGQRPASGRF